MWGNDTSRGLLTSLKALSLKVHPPLGLKPGGFSETTTFWTSSSGISLSLLVVVTGLHSLMERTLHRSTRGIVDIDYGDKGKKLCPANLTFWKEA